MIPFVNAAGLARIAHDSLIWNGVIMAELNGAVLEYGVPEPAETASVMADKLRFHTDSWDLSVDLKSGQPDLVVIDTRSRQAYADGYIPGAVSLPHREMTDEAAGRLDRRKVYVVYCDGIGSNASTKGAYKLSLLGFRAKELLGGLDWWRRDGHPVATSREPGSLDFKVAEKVAQP